MGEQTVKLTSHSLEYYEAQVAAEVARLERALEQWLEGKTEAQPQLQDVAELRRLLLLKQSNEDWSSYEGYWMSVTMLAQKRFDAATPAAATVGELIAHLQGLDPSLPIQVVAAEHTGCLNAIETQTLG